MLICIKNDYLPINSQHHKFNNQLRLHNQPRFIMLAKQFRNLLKQALSKKGYSFSAQKKLEPPTQQQQPKPAEKPQRPKNQYDEYEEQEEEELHKQDRNTPLWMLYRAVFWSTFSLLGFNMYLVFSNDGKTPVEQQTLALPGLIDVAKATKKKYYSIAEFITEPPSSKLLPDPVHPLFHPNTLVLNLSGTLIKADFQLGKGMTITRRPGLDNFLKKLAQKYEIIIFSDDDQNFMMNAINLLDPRHMIFAGAFGRESMVLRGGYYIKDMKYLNRDLRNVIVIDKDRQTVRNQPDNVIVLNEFDGSETDEELTKLLTLLEGMSDKQREIRDVRRYLKTLGEKPHEKFYEKVSEKIKNIQQKQESSVFGLFNQKKPTNPSFIK